LVTQIDFFLETKGNIKTYEKSSGKIL
jgi:hypothetical protein